jgi:hypothetical protein
MSTPLDGRINASLHLIKRRKRRLVRWWIAKFYPVTDLSVEMADGLKNSQKLANGGTEFVATPPRPCLFMERERDAHAARKTTATLWAGD